MSLRSLLVAVEAEGLHLAVERRAVEAEALGYRSSFLVEHHFTGWNQVSATLMLQTALAMRTTTLRLGTGVLINIVNPEQAAEELATPEPVAETG